MLKPMSQVMLGLDLDFERGLGLGLVEVVGAGLPADGLASAAAAAVLRLRLPDARGGSARAGSLERRPLSALGGALLAGRRELLWRFILAASKIR